MGPALISFFASVLVGLITIFFSTRNVGKTINSQLEQQNLKLESDSKEQKKKLVAEEISKSRIEWLKVTRQYVSDYMSACNMCYFYYQKMNILDARLKVILSPCEEKNIIDEQKALNKKIDDCKLNAENNYYKSIYSVNPKENIKIFLDKYIMLTQNNLVNPRYKDELTRIVGEEVQEYFKNEWNKAKKEIINGNVESTKGQEKRFMAFDDLNKMFSDIVIVSRQRMMVTDDDQELDKLKKKLIIEVNMFKKSLDDSYDLNECPKDKRERKFFEFSVEYGKNSNEYSMLDCLRKIELSQSLKLIFI